MEKRLTMSLDDIIKSKAKPSDKGKGAADQQTRVRASRATYPTLVFWRTDIVHWKAFGLWLACWQTNRCNAQIVVDFNRLF